MGLVDKTQERKIVSFFFFECKQFLKMLMVCLLDVVGYGAHQCWFRKGKMFNHWPNVMSGGGNISGTHFGEQLQQKLAQRNRLAVAFCA